MDFAAETVCRHVIAVIVLSEFGCEAEESAIAQYKKIIKICDGVDYPTQDLAIELLSDEEEHRREFVGFLKEYEKR